MGICIISRFAFAGRFTGGGVPVTLSALHYPPMKRRGMDLEGFSRGLTNSPLDCWFRRSGAVALFESSPCQNKK